MPKLVLGDAAASKDGEEVKNTSGEPDEGGEGAPAAASADETTHETEGLEDIPNVILPEGHDGTFTDKGEEETDETKKDKEVADKTDGEGEPADGGEPEETDLTREQQALEALKAQKSDLLKEITTLRTVRRDARDGKPVPDLIVPAEKKAEEDPLADIPANDVALVERILKAKGYVRQDQLQEKEINASIDGETNAWLEAHPEYKVENDPDDTRWKALNAVLKEHGIPKPSDPKKIAGILDFAHFKVGGKPATLPVKKPAAVAAAKEKISSAGKGSPGGNGSPSKPSTAPAKKNIDLSGLKGFTKEELDEMLT